jgi:predicted metalloprotease with PDZ domain
MEVQKPRDAGSGKIEWQKSFEIALRTASRQSKPMMLVFYGVSSRRLDRNVFSAPDVIELAREFICLKIGADQGDLAQRYMVQEYPTVVFADPQGGEYDKFVGYRSRLSFVEILKSALVPVEAEYTLRIKASQPQLASVKCVFRNVRWSSLILSIYEKHDKIYNISYDCEGDRPGWEEIVKNTWLMKFTIDGMKTVTVQYEVGLNIKSTISYEPEYVSYVGDDYGVLDGHALFLMPQNLHMIGKIEVHLGLPPGWFSITPWKAIGHSSFVADSVDEVVDSVFCIGEFQYVKSDLGDHEIYAVLCGAEEGAIDLEQKSSEMVEIFRDYVMRFGDFPFKRFLGIFAGPTADGSTAHGSAHGAGFIGPVYVDHTFVAHEIFHVWNGGMIFPKSEYEAWFKEGFTQYYGYLTPYRTELYSEERFARHLKRDYERYLTKYGTEGDMPLTRVREELARREGHNQPESARLWIMYHKGALVASLLDREISKRTDNRKSLDDLMYYMFRGFRKQQYSSEDILEALNIVTGQDFSQFFSDFVYGTTKLPRQGETPTEKVNSSRQR